MNVETEDALLLVPAPARGAAVWVGEPPTLAEWASRYAVTAAAHAADAATALASLAVGSTGDGAATVVHVYDGVDTDSGLRTSPAAHASIVLHQPRSGARGQATDIQIRAQEVLHNKRTLLEMLSLNTGKSVEQLSRDSDRMTYFTAEEAKEYGLIDRVLTSLKDLPTAPPATAAGLG